jgi:solute carrier family 25 carnitine/acylcarnitine transporter 20/29
VLLFVCLLQGLLSPLVGNLPINAIVFGARGNADRMLDELVPRSAADRASGRPSYWRGTVAALWAGWLQLIVLVPVELVKCKLQVQQTPVAPTISTTMPAMQIGMINPTPSAAAAASSSTAASAAAAAAAAASGGSVATVSTGPRYTGPWDCASQILRGSGIRGLYAGYWVTAWRDVPAYAAWFVAYDATKSFLTSDEDARGGRPTSTRTALLAGSVAGVATWVSTYPFDVLKSVIQTAPSGTPARELTMAHVARTNYRLHGAAFFFKGLSPTIIRAIPVSAVTFYVYERCLDWMGRE